MERNKTTCVERILSVLDPESFVEIGAYVGKNADGSDLTGVVCGYGAVDGRLVYIFSQDPDRRLGAMDVRHAAKIERLYQMALSNGAPVIGIFDSAGAPVEDGAEALDAYGRVMRCVTRASGVIPQIAYVAGVCAGMSATVAAMFDFTVMINGKSRYYITSPFILGGKVGTAAAAAESGVASLLAEDEQGAAADIRKLLSMIPSNNADGTETVQTDYTITGTNFISSIDYTVIAKDETYLFANRSFVRGTEKKTGVFDSVASLQKSVKIDFLFVGEEQQGRHFEIPAGVYLGIDTADYAYEFFYDESCTQPYAYDTSVIMEDTVLYVRAKA